jgi:putative methionine-R-sulfoxide reductase with GAF domain
MEKHQEKCGILEKLRKKENAYQELTKKLIEYAQQNRDNQKTIENLQKQISDLQSKLENIAIQGVKKSTTTNILKLEPMTKDWLDTQALLLTDSHFSKGVAGLAQFAVNNSFKDRVVCTDANRKSLRYKEEDGKISKDPKGKKLSKMFFESIQSKADDMLPAMIEKIKQELDDAGEEPSVFDAIMGKITELINVEKGIKQISKGEEHDLKEEFTRELCELLPNP